MNARCHLKAAVLVSAVVTALAAPQSAYAACGQPPEPRPGTWCFVDGAHVRVWYSLPTIFAAANSDVTTATLVANDVETRLWQPYSDLLRRVPVSDGEGRIYRFN